MKEKQIPLGEALEEVLKESQFMGFSAEQKAAIENLQREEAGVKGCRDIFARKVAAKAELLSRQEPDLSPIAAFNKATALVIREDPNVLLDYRADSETI